MLNFCLKRLPTCVRPTNPRTHPLKAHPSRPETSEVTERAKLLHAARMPVHPAPRLYQPHRTDGGVPSRTAPVDCSVVGTAAYRRPGPIRILLRPTPFFLYSTSRSPILRFSDSPILRFSDSPILRPTLWCTPRPTQRAATSNSLFRTRRSFLTAPSLLLQPWPTSRTPQRSQWTWRR